MILPVYSLNALILYSGLKTASNVFDHAKSFKEYSRFKINYVDVTSHLPTLDNMNKYDIIVIHHSVPILEDQVCPPILRLVIRYAKSKKVLFLQDEYRKVNQVRELLIFMKVDLLFTTVPNDDIELIYPSSILPKLRKVHTLPGFVPESLLIEKFSTYDQRQIDVGYRARKLSYWYGRLGQEKWKIGEKFLIDAKNFNLRTDISWRNEDRIYGEDWVKFLKDTKAVIGSEGGSSIYDFTGDIQKNVEYYESLNPNASFEEVENKFFQGVDGKITYNMMSPRGFECAALRTLMILYEANYSGILIPWRHYVPLKRDHANMAQVVEYIITEKLWKKITEQAYFEVACNPKYSYKKFIYEFDEKVEELFKDFDSHILFSPNQFSKNLPYASYDKVEEKGISVTAPFRKRFIVFCIQLVSYSNQLNSCLRRIKRRLKQLKEIIFYKYELSTEISSYRKLCIKNVGLDLIHVLNKDSSSIEILIAPDGKIEKDISLDNVPKKELLKLRCSNSWGLPEKIRGKSMDFKLKFYLKKILK